MERPRTGHWARRESWLTHTSPSQTSPRSGGSSSPSRLSSVDLPQPEGPATATNSPAPTSASTPSSTGTGPPSGPRNVLLRPTARTRIGATSGSAPDGLGGRQPHDAQGGVGRGEPAQDGGEDEGEEQEPGREQEELLAVAQHARVDDEPDREGEDHSDGAPRDRHREGLGQDLAQELEVGGAEGALDAEVTDALEDRRGHGVGERRPPDHEAQHPDAEEQGREERGGLAQDAAQLARDRDVDPRHRRLDAPREVVGVDTVGPRHRGPGVEVAPAHSSAAARKDLHQ